LSRYGLTRDRFSAIAAFTRRLITAISGEVEQCTGDWWSDEEKVRTEVVDDEEAIRAAAGGFPEGLAVRVAADGGEEANGALAQEVARVRDGVAEAVDGVHGARGRRRLHEPSEQQY
jgi:hypothetical protein